MITRRLITLVVALISLVTLSSCAGIPQSGSVQEGGSAAGPGLGDIEYLPSGPIDGASPQQILRGFLEASSSPQNDFAVARQFLTPRANTDWNPTALTLIDSGTRTFGDETDDTIQLSISTTAVLDSEGRYTEQQVATRYDLPFAFEQESGQWRIARLPQGIVIDDTTFTQVFRQSSLYFLTPDKTWLVPDVRWFPSRASTTTRIAKALLSGPSAWLTATGAAVSAFPSGTKLVADAVPIQNGTAIVDLDARGAEATLPATRLMQIQLLASLGQVPGVSAVDLLISGNTQLDQGTRQSMMAMMPTVDSRPAVLRGKTFGFAVGSGVSPVGSFPTTLSLPSCTALTLSLDLSRLAALTLDGVVTLLPDGRTTVVDERPDLIAPAMDGKGFVWTVPSDDSTELLAWGRDGKPHPVGVPWSSSARLAAVRISLDSSRVVAFYQDDSGNHLVVSSIARAPDGTPEALGTPVDLVAPAGRPVDAVWLDSITVAAVAVDAAGTGALLRQAVGGRSTEYSASAAPMALAGGNNADQLRLLLDGGALVSPRTTGSWTTITTKVDVLATIQ